LAAPITVSSSPVKISSRVSKPYLIANTSTTATVYLGQDPNITTNNFAITLTPGQALTWTEINSEVWAISSSGNAVVSIAYEANAVFSSTVNIANATIPVSGSVNANITNATLAVAGNVNVTNASIPVSGSVAISSGSVSVTSGSVNVNAGNITAAVGSTPTLLSTQTINYTTSSSTTVDTFLTDVNIQPYSSVIIQITVQSTSTPSTALSIPNGAFIEFSGIQSNTQLTPQSTTTWQRTNDAIWSFGDAIGSNGGSGTVLLAGIQTYQYRVTNNWQTSSWIRYNTGTATTATGIITIRIYGSYEAINNDRYVNIPGASRFPVANAFVTSGALAAPGTTVIYAPSINGDATLSVSNNAVATLTYMGYRLSYYDGTGNQRINIANVPTPGVANTGLTNTVKLPNAPVVYEVISTGTGNVFFTVIQNR
jgi:hypothetical protein